MGIKGIIKPFYLKLYHSGIFNNIPDRVFVPFQYWMATGKKLKLNNASTFNEKIQWMKLFDRNPIYPIVVDKYKVRDYVSERIGSDYLIPLLGKWDSLDAININSLPEQFVLKCNHDSGGISICQDKCRFDWNKEKKKLAIHMRQNHYYLSREWAYKDVKPCIIAEKYMVDMKTGELRDYKFFCFNGKPRYVQVDFNRFVNHKRNIYDLNWNLIDLAIKCPNDPNKSIEKPENFNIMLEVAKKLSVGFPQVRVDLYSVNENVYFGELTLYHGNGFEKFTPEKYGEEFGSYIDLSLCMTNRGDEQQ
ncbi:MAG: glycosyl transferase [Clostridiaceae bacterium]|nr:glycosyl transferase [Clostridiaceae bacterium]